MILIILLQVTRNLLPHQQRYWYAPSGQNNPLVTVVAPASRSGAHIDGLWRLTSEPVENVGEDAKNQEGIKLKCMWPAD